jgi:hypothetical protein
MQCLQAFSRKLNKKQRKGSISTKCKLTIAEKGLCAKFGAEPVWTAAQCWTALNRRAVAFTGGC